MEKHFLNLKKKNWANTFRRNCVIVLLFDTILQLILMHVELIENELILLFFNISFFKCYFVTNRLQSPFSNATIKRKSEGKQKREKGKKDGKQKKPWQCPKDLSSSVWGDHSHNCGICLCFYKTKRIISSLFNLRNMEYLKRRRLFKIIFF